MTAPASTSLPKVSVIVPTYRRFECLIRTVEDLLSQDYAAFEVIVVDQNPSWPTDLEPRRSAIRADPRVQWLVLGSPGVVVARNRAVAASTGEILLFVDDDVLIPHRQLLARHVSAYATPEIAAVIGRERPHDASHDDDDRAPSGVVLPPPPGLTALQQVIWFNRNGDDAQQVCAFSTCNSSIRRSAFLAVGGFDELYSGNAYGDDSDLALRLHARGSAMVYEPAAWLIHRRVPMGGLRLSDRTNMIDEVASAHGLWLFVLRHGHRGMYRYLVVQHVLRKTVLLKRNVTRPWREFRTATSLVRAFFRARKTLHQGPQSIFAPTH